MTPRPYCPPGVERVDGLHKTMPWPVQFRRLLTPCKRAGIPFDEAWEWTVRSYNGAYSTERRRDDRALIDTMRPVWRDAYENTGEIPGGVVLVALADMLTDDASTPATGSVHAVSTTGRIAA